MPICPECGAAYEKGIKTCSDCGVTLVSESAYNEIRSREEEFHKLELVELAKSPNAHEAMSWREHLSSAGIKVITEPEVGHVDPLPGAPFFSDYRILVPKQELEAARRVLDSLITQPGIPREEASDDNE